MREKFNIWAEIAYSKIRVRFAWNPKKKRVSSILIITTIIPFDMQCFLPLDNLLPLLLTCYNVDVIKWLYDRGILFQDGKMFLCTAKYH